MRNSITAFLLLLTTSSWAQTDSTFNQTLSEIVVTGQYKPQSLKNSVFQVKTINREAILRQAATNIQTVLNNELNIRFSQDLSTGGSNITMMGLKGQNVKILLDGIPITGRQGTSNEININQIDVNTIERIEIIEGPMSVVFGADALAGVINIITKKQHKPALSIQARIHEESVGGEYGIKQGIHNQYAGLSWKKGNWELGGGIGHNYFGGWKDSAIGRELVWHKKDQIMANGFVGFKKEKWQARYRFDGLDEIITNPGNFNPLMDPINGQHFAEDQQYLTARIMHQLQGSYYFSPSANFQLQSSYTDYSRQVFSTKLSQETGKETIDLGQGKQTIDQIKGITTRGIFTYIISPKISVQPGVDYNFESGEGDRLKQGKNGISDVAFFLTSEITPTTKINIRPGIRLIRNSIYDAPPIIPSINAKWVITPSLDFRMAYAQGFRAPSLRELYFNFFDANHQVVGNPDLKAETSNSFTGSLNWNKKLKEDYRYSIVLKGFYNDVRNLIDYAVSSSNSNLVELTNVSKSKSTGVNILVNAHYKEWQFAIGASETGFYNDYSLNDNKLPDLLWSGEININSTYSLPKIGMDISLFYKLTGKLPYYTRNNNQEIVLAKQGSYQMADISMRKKINHLLSINAGVRNLFNVSTITSNAVGSHNTSGNRNIASGRGYFISLQFQFDKLSNQY